MEDILLAALSHPSVDPGILAEQVSRLQETMKDPGFLRKFSAWIDYRAPTVQTTSRWYITGHAIEQFQKRIAPYSKHTIIRILSRISWLAVFSRMSDDGVTEEFQVPAFSGLSLRVSPPYPGRKGSLLATVIVKPGTDIGLLRRQLDDLMKEKP